MPQVVFVVSKEAVVCIAIHASLHHPQRKRCLTISLMWTDRDYLIRNIQLMLAMQVYKRREGSARECRICACGMLCHNDCNGERECASRGLLVVNTKARIRKAPSVRNTRSFFLLSITLDSSYCPRQSAAWHDLELEQHKPQCVYTWLMLLRTRKSIIAYIATAPESIAPLAAKIISFALRVERWPFFCVIYLKKKNNNIDPIYWCNNKCAYVCVCSFRILLYN